MMRIAYLNGLGALLLIASVPARPASLECDAWQDKRPEWIWCDDFESDAALPTAYFEVNRAGGSFGVSNEAPFGGVGSLRATFRAGAQEAGNVKLGFGRSPVATRVAGDRNFDDVYWRFYTKTGPNWAGNPQKLTRATIFARSNWAQAAIGHLWEDSASLRGLGLDPVTGVSGDQVVTTQYNDFANLRWLGKRNGQTQVFDDSNRERWFCIEVRMKLNTPGAADGIFAFWVDGKLEAESRTLDWRGRYVAYGINAIMLENYVNTGFSQVQSRYFDNFIVSTQPIGCQGIQPVRPRPPTSVQVES
jgi:hypothetical protein